MRAQYIVVVAVLLSPGLAWGQVSGTVTNSCGGLPCVPVAAPNGGPIPTLDGNGAAFADMVPVTSGVAFTPAGRSIGFYCTTGGSLTLLMALAGRSVVVPIQGATSLQTLPLSVTGITISGGAVCPNLWNLP